MKDLEQIKFLIERIEKPKTMSEVYKLEEEFGREDVDTTEFFDYITNIKGGKKVTVGYLSAASLNIPQIKKKNPETGRMKNYDDWESFGKSLNVEGNIGGVVKFAVYKAMNWRTPSNMTKHYNKNYVEPFNAIRGEFGLEPIQKRGGYTNDIEFGYGSKGYAGDKEELRQHTYSPQDIAPMKGFSKDVFYYIVDTEGKIIKQIDEQELIPYFKSRSIDGVAALRKLGKSDEEIEQYIQKVKSLNFKYANFEHSSIVYVIATVDGQKKQYFNNRLTEYIKGVKIDRDEFLNIARKYYTRDLKEPQPEVTDVEEIEDTEEIGG